MRHESHRAVKEPGPHEREQQQYHKQSAPCRCGEEGGGTRACALIVNEPGTRDRCEQIVAIDHLVVEHRSGRVGPITLEVIEHGALADILLVRHLSLRRQPLEH